MNLSHVNYFVPFESAAARHENQLTRALLVVLRYSPMAHQAWLELVSTEKPLHALPVATYATQRQRVLPIKSDVPEGEPIRGISVWLAPDASPPTAQVEPSERQQILDGIITYGSELVIVIENKIGWYGATDQATQINLHGSPVEFKELPHPVSWQVLLGALSDLVERDLVSGAEHRLITDFLDFVEHHFPRIGPYSTLARCGKNPYRIAHRLDTIQGEAVGTDVSKALGGRDLAGTQKIAMAWLEFERDNSAVCLRLAAGDTLGQARALYGDPSSVDAVLALRSDGWCVKPNFHWGFMAGGYAWSKSALPVEQYCAYWINEIGETRELNRPEWEAYWAKLQSAQIVEAAAKKAFDVEFTQTQRQKVHPRPGLSCEYTWPLADAQQLDADGKFVAKVRARINQMLTALHAPVIPARRGMPNP